MSHPAAGLRKGSLMRREPITFACVSKPWLHKLENLVPKVLPFVDKAVIVIGEDDEPAKEYLKSLGPKVECYYHKWEDNFARQWNNYLQHINEGWILLCDDDETPSDEMLQSLDWFINNSLLGEKFCFVEFRCHNISEEQLAPEPANYWRQMFFRYNSSMTYKGGPITGCHQYIVGHQNGKGVRCNAVYYHDKSLKEEYQHASRNYFIYGIWPHGSQEGQQREEWHNLKNVLETDYPPVSTFPELDDFLVAGNITKNLKSWMINTYNEYRDHPEYNEMRALVQYYFKFLHPEEKPDSFEL